jgi:hypothetical protein
MRPAIAVFGLAGVLARANIGHGQIRRCALTVLKSLTVAAAVLALSISAAIACDDYEEELALAEAMKASKLAQSTDQPTAPSAQSAPALAPVDQTNIAAAEAPKGETPPGPLRQ